MAIFQMIVLVLPLAGLTYTFARVAHRAGAAGWGWSAGSALRRGVLVGATAAAIGLAAFVLWPQPGEYRPIQPGERGTLFGALDQVRHLPSGRPALTPERLQQLQGAPSEREIQRTGRDPRAAGGEAPSKSSRSESAVQSSEDAPDAGGGAAIQDAPESGAADPQSWSEPDTSDSAPAPAPEEQPTTEPPATTPQEQAPPADDPTATPEPTTTTAPDGSTTTAEPPPPQSSGSTTTPTP
jgi:putative peptide zinc metalloprotease protein